MAWLMWRQHRNEALVVCVALASLAVFLLATGLSIDATYRQLGVGNCLGASAPPNCVDILDAFHADTGLWRGSTFYLAFVPMLLAMLVGAPLVAREFEGGTFRLVWTQSLPRLRWLRTKLVLVVGASLAVTAVETVLVSWWRVPFAQLSSNLDPQQFNVEGIVALAYMAYALALAIVAGTILRKAIPAMAVTVVGFLAIRFPIEYLVRPYYLPPQSATWDPFVQTPIVNPGNGGWVVGGDWIDRAGHTVDDAQVVGACTTNAIHYNLQPATPFTSCTHAHGWLVQLVWQPVDRYWLFQGIESAIFFGLAAVLLVLAIYWIRRRIA